MPDTYETLKQVWAAALADFQAGRLIPAEAGYRRVLATAPDHPGANYNLAVTLKGQGRLDDAAAQYVRTLAIQPGNPKAHNNLGVILVELGRSDEALGHYRRALAAQADFPSAHYNLANLLKARGELAAAIDHYRRALATGPDDPEILNNFGVALAADGQTEAAEAAYRRALAARPDYAQACSNLGAVLVELDRPQEAAPLFQQALALKPDYADARFNLAHALEEEGREAAAELQYELALALDPAHAEAHNNFGLLSQRFGRLDEALARFERAQALKPDYPEAQWNESLARLVTGDFETGWRKYESRWRRKDAPPRPLPAPLWEGDDLTGKTILLHAEQGLGDAIQFIRYAPLVKARGAATVIFECLASQRRLLEGVPGVDLLVTAGQPLPKFDRHAPLLSLPTLLETRLETLPADIPYLAAEPDLAAAWRERLSGLKRRKVGLVWRGNPKHPNDRRRSAPVAAVAPLVASADVDWVSLQFDARPDELAAFGDTPVLDAGALIEDWSDTAAAVANLDLVITVDTSTAHLAGALGKPVWVMLPFAPDWRWLLDRSDSPWYPTMRLFRQAAPDDWASAVAQVRAALSGQDSAALAAPALTRRRLPPALVVSHERSGTHFLMNSLSYGFAYTAEPWIDLDVHAFDIDWTDPGAVADTLEAQAGDGLLRLVKSHHDAGQIDLARLSPDWRIFYIRRDPAETMISLWRHLNGLSWDEGPKAARPLALAKAAPSGRMTRYQSAPYPTMLQRWSAHVEGWLAAARNDPRITVVRYEDLDARHAETVEALAPRVGRAPLSPLLRPPRDVNVIAMGISADAAAMAPAEIDELRLYCRSEGGYAPTDKQSRA